MATPKVSSRDVKDQKALGVVYDLFNTFATGFTLALETETSKSQKVRVNSGPIGTGDFNNNIYLVYILQVIAARFVEAKAASGDDIKVDDIVLFEYEDAHRKKSEELLEDLDKKFAGLTDKSVLALLKLIPSLDIPPNP